MIQGLALLGIHKRIEIRSSNRYLYTNVHSIIHNNQKVKTTQMMPVNMWKDKQKCSVCIYIYVCVHVSICIYVYRHIYMQYNIIQPKRDKILMYAAKWMNVKNIMLVKYARHKRANLVWFYLCEVSRIGKFIETEDGCQGLLGRGSGNCCLMGIKFLSGRIVCR